MEGPVGFEPKSQSLYDRLLENKQPPHRAGKACYAVRARLCRWPLSSLLPLQSPLSSFSFSLSSSVSTSSSFARLLAVFSGSCGTEFATIAAIALLDTGMSLEAHFAEVGRGTHFVFRAGGCSAGDPDFGRYARRGLGGATAGAACACSGRLSEVAMMTIDIGSTEPHEGHGNRKMTLPHTGGMTGEKQQCAT